ncbi:MAG: hypothetical protein ABUL61_00270, partial [Oleiharenicola lentus]
MIRRSSLLLFTLGILLGAGALFGHRVYTRHALAARYIPAVPALSDRPAALAESLAEAEARSRDWLKSTRGLAELSRLYHANGFYPEAMTCYDGLRLLEPANARWPHLQASIITNFGRMDEALPLRQQAVELAPDYIPARLRLGDVLLKGNRPAD